MAEQGNEQEVPQRRTEGLVAEFSIREREFQRFRWILKFWTTRSRTVLDQVESRILSHIRTPYEKFYVNISNLGVGATSRQSRLRIWTIALNRGSEEVPLVLLHGLGGGIALWLLNFDSMAQKRPVYAIDIIGFGRSSRPIFPETAEDCEWEFVRCLEEWRRVMNLKKFILLGHSFGGYLVTCYAMHYPDHVVGLILADPWGFLVRPTPVEAPATLPRWARPAVTAMPPMKPLWPLRAAGPLGKWILQKIRSDILNKFDEVSPNLSNDFLTYILQCNVQKPTGEGAFQAMMLSYFWAKNPMIDRVHLIAKHIPMTFIIGENSWIDSATGSKVQEKREGSIVDVNIIENSGHHVYALQPDSFNRFVNSACDKYNLSVESHQEAL